MKYLRTLILILLYTLPATAQQRQEYIFTNYSTSNGGLATNLLNGMAQDEKGYMWLATYNGLQRFDGNKFLTFRNHPDNATTIPNNNIQTLLIDKAQRLWLAGTDNSIGYFHTSRFMFKEVPIQHKKKGTSYIPKHFLETPDGQLLLYEEKGAIYRFQESAGQFVPDTNSIKLPFGWKVNRMAWDGLIHKYWIACDSGLVVYNPATRLLSYRGHNTEQDPVISRFEKEAGIANVYVNAGNSVSFYTRSSPSHQLYHYNRNTGRATIEQPGKKLGINFYEIHGMFHQRNGRIWVHGVKLFSQWRPAESALLPVSSFPNAEYKIKSNYVNLIFEDRENNLWVATDNGLFVFNPDAQLFHSFRLSQRSVAPKEGEEEDILPMSTHQTKDENLYIGTWQAGLFLFDKHHTPQALPQPLQTLKKNLTIWNIREHKASGQLWLAVEDEHAKGLMVYDPKKQRIQWVKNPILEGVTIRNIEEDEEGNLWLGTREGHLFKWQHTPDIQKGYVLFAKLPNLIRKLFKDQQGFMWVVTNNRGLLKIDPSANKIAKDFTNETVKGYQLANSDLVEVLQYNDSTLIVAAEAALNLVDLRTHKVTSITTTDGLPAQTIRSIQKDKKGNLWLGLLGGICRVNLEQQIFTVYDRKDGIPYDNFLTVRALQLQNGQLVFPTSENLLVIDPAKAVLSNITRQPLLTAFYLANKPLSVDSLLRNPVKLNYDNSSISIGFSNLSFLKQRTQRYYYKLEGLDKDWKAADASHQAQYNYIQPGSYTFLVKTMNEDGAISETATLLEIVVTPPFWKTGLFYALLTLLALLIFFLIDKERMKRLRVVQQMRSQLAGDLHKDIHGTLNDINVLSAMAKIKADKDIDRSKDFIDTISIKSRDIMESMEDILWTLDPENDSMKKMLLRMQEYTDGIRNSHKANIELSSDRAVKDLLLDMRRRHEFLLFYKHALSFILEKLHFPSIHVSMEYTKGKLTLHLNAQSTVLQEASVNAHFFEEELYKKAEALKADLQLEDEGLQLAVLLQLSA